MLCEGYVLRASSESVAEICEGLLTINDLRAKL